MAAATSATRHSTAATVSSTSPKRLSVDGFYPLTSPKASTRTRIAVVHFSKELGLQVPSSSLIDERDLIVAITSAETFPQLLFHYFTILKIHATLPELFPLLVSILQENAKLGSTKALKVLGQLLPVLRLLLDVRKAKGEDGAGRGDGDSGATESPPSSVSSCILPESALDAAAVQLTLTAVAQENQEESDVALVVDLAAAYLILGVPYMAAVQPTTVANTCSLVLCREWEKWNYQSALLIAHWASEALNERHAIAYRGEHPVDATTSHAAGGDELIGTAAVAASPQGSSPIASPRKEGSAALPAGSSSTIFVDGADTSMMPLTTTDAAEINTTISDSRAHSPEMGSLTSSGTAGCGGGGGGGRGGRGSVSLCFPNKLPSKVNIPAAATITSLVLCARGLHKQIVVQLSVWCLRCLKSGVLPMSCALALNRLVTDHPGSVQKLVFEGVKFLEAVLISSLQQSTAMLEHAGAKNTSAACQGVVPMMRLALCCVTQQVKWGVLLGKDAQHCIGESLRYIIQWYLSLVPHVNPLADDAVIAASATHPAAKQLFQLGQSWLGFNKALALPVRLILTVADVALHAYDAGCPEYLRAALVAPGMSSLFKQLHSVDLKIHETQLVKKNRLSSAAAAAKKQHSDAESVVVPNEGEQKQHDYYYGGGGGEFQTPSHFIDLLETFLFFGDFQQQQPAASSPTVARVPQQPSSLAGLLPASAPAIPTHLTAPMAQWGIEHNRHMVASDWMAREVTSKRAARTSNLVRVVGSAEGQRLSFGSMDYFASGTPGSRQFPFDV